ncbi:glycosyltransferase [Knoellia aerolata]|uniref:Glycosyl transferase family 1 domain-containing protein n=1 Tax=Knoellia aerolata DSM 18566 TaxID=1385519 RepID=A0A0A0JUU2_9MICO|nr:glycosyltransferase [Knoellia aerolata]KGN40918.1 hypothetical protein N801_10680 [Knoellia aerolata DSM 18566]
MTRTVDVSFVTSGHDVADARLHRLVSAARAADLEVEVLGLGDVCDGPPGVRVHTVARGSMAGRVMTALRYARAARGSVLVALDPDSLVACSVVARVRRRRFVADVHEDYLALLRDRAWAQGWKGTLGGALVRVATAVAARADLVVVADHHVPPVEARHRLVVTNRPDVEMLPGPTDRSPEPRAIYVGDVRSSRGLFTMVEAVRLAPGWRLDIVGPVAAADREELDVRLGDPELAARVRLVGRKPPREAWEHARGAWCGLALLDRTPAFVDALPSKLSEYLSAGLAVIVSDLPRQAELVRASGAGAVVEADPARVAEVLRDWAAHPDVVDEHRSAARSWVKRELPPKPYAVLGESLRKLAR